MSRVVFGASCCWWDGIEAAAQTTTGLPCCPHCGGVLHELEEESWWRFAREHGKEYGVARESKESRPGAVVALGGSFYRRRASMKYSYDRTAGTRIAQGISSLDVLNLTQKAKDALIKLDEKYIGTDNYMGVAFFWSISYKWWLRDASPKVRRKVHEAFRKAGLVPEDDSPKHRAIIEKFFPDAKRRLEEMDED